MPCYKWLPSAAVLERGQGGRWRRRDLPGAWAPHYHPRLSAVDLTGDGQRELVRYTGQGAAGGYAQLLSHVGHDHLLWDADGDGLPEIAGTAKLDLPPHIETETFRWDGRRYVAWHTAR